MAGPVASMAGMARAAHAGPSVVVTLVVTALAVAVGNDARTCALVGLAVLTGQLSIGWCNDARDAPDDIALRRADKPVVAGSVTRRSLAVGAGAALIASIALSLAAGGVGGGGWHVLAVLSGWSYDLLLKATPLSFVPYAFSFGVLPVFVTGCLEPPARAAWWAVVAAACLGVAAHLANAAPDLEGDRLTGRAGVVGVIGQRIARLLAALLLVTTTALLVLGPPTTPAWAVVLLAAATIAVVACVFVRAGQWLFPAIMALAVIDAALLVAASDAFVIVS